MDIVRTPDERFAGLPGYDFAPHYAEIADGALRVHYLDEGPRDGQPVLLMHGEPSWSYLYRKVIPLVVAAGHRCIAPDLVGFGRSDKPVAQADYTYARHVAWMSELVFDQLNIEDVTFFGQDWGSLIGLRLVAAEPDRFARVAIGNGGMPTGDRPPNDAFLGWQKFSQETPDCPVGAIVAGGCAQPVSPEVMAAYDAPFPDDMFKAGARKFPLLVPTSPADPEHDANVAAWDVLKKFDKPFLCTFSDADAITRGGERQFIGVVPGTDGQPHTTVAGGGHFLQEDRGEDLGRILADFIASTT
jgi:haloalkane dehalogenase